MVSTAAGFVCTIIAILSNGSFAAFVKIPRVQQCKMEPLTFVLFLTLGVALSSFVSPLFYSVLPDAPPHAVFTWWGFLGGFLFTMSSVFSFTAIKFVGLALAQGTRCPSCPLRFLSLPFLSAPFPSLPAALSDVMMLLIAAFFLSRSVGRGSVACVIPLGRSSVRQPHQERRACRVGSGSSSHRRGWHCLV